MQVSRTMALSAALATFVTTTGLVIVHIILIIHPAPGSTDRIAAIIAASLESILLMMTSWAGSKYLFAASAAGTKRCDILFGSSMTTCILATAASAAASVCLAKSNENWPQEILGVSKGGLAALSVVMLVLAFGCQLFFIIVHFIWSPAKAMKNGATDVEAVDESTRRAEPGRAGRMLNQINMKSVRYSKTMPAVEMDCKSIDSRTPPQSIASKSIAGKSCASETISSLRSSLSNAVRPMTSKTRLVGSLREKPSARPSYDSSVYREGSIMTQDTIESWDLSTENTSPNSDSTSSRLTIMSNATPLAPPRFLETIPASPTVSHNSSTGHLSDLEPPPRNPCRRSRSYSPARRVHMDVSHFTAPAAAEANIHPLFRSDSPGPAPNVTPDTIVTAAPDAARVTLDRDSARRMRSSSLTTARESTYSHHPNNSEVSTIRGTPSLAGTEASASTVTSPGVSDLAEAEAASGLECEELPPPPPIPGWILGAGSRSSLTDYEIRKMRDAEINAGMSPTPSP